LVQITDLILSNIALYGPWIMGLGLMISAAGLPIPISPIVVAAGAAALVSHEPQPRLRPRFPSEFVKDPDSGLISKI
jgi:hypothetical protein